MCEASPSSGGGGGGSSNRNSSPRPKLRPPAKVQSAANQYARPAPKKTTKTYTDTSSLAGIAKASGGSTAKKITTASNNRQDNKPAPVKTASVGYGMGQVDPRLAKAAGIKDSGKKPVLDGKGGIVKSSNGTPVTTRSRPTTTTSSGSDSGGSSAPAPKTASAPASAPANGNPATTPLALDEAYSDRKASAVKRRRRGGKRQFTIGRKSTTGIGGVQSGGSGLNIPK